MDKQHFAAMETETTEQPAQKKGRGKKPAAAAVKPKAPAARKRAPTQGGKATQKKIDEMLRATEDNNTSASSPEKKVRKMRSSPFNKKSGSILQRGSTASASSGTTVEASPPSGSSAEPVGAAQPRRTARATKKPIYISDPEDEVELIDDSDFDADGDSDE